MYFKFLLFYLFIASLIHASVQLLQDLKKKIYIYALNSLSVLDLCVLSVISFGAFLAIITPNISSVPFTLSSPAGTPITHTLYLLKLSHSSKVFYSFLKLFFPLHSNLKNLHWSLMTLTDSCTSCHIYSWNHSKHLSLLLQCFFISTISFWFVFSASVSQLTLPICSHHLAVFPISALSVLFMVILNSLADDSIASCQSLVFSDLLFLLWVCLVSFCDGCWKQYMLYWVIETGK